MTEFINSSIEKIDEYIGLYNRTFPKLNKNKKYFDWLYKLNPCGNFIGIDCYSDKIIIGQVGGIPLEFNYLGKKVKFLISINVCVDPKHQGKKLFSKMAIKFEVLAKKEGFDGIIAIANKAATPAWQKTVNLNFLKQLDVFIGFGKFNNKKLDKNKYNFFTKWNNENLKWRLGNPHNKTFSSDYNQGIKSIYSSTDYPLLKAYAPLVFATDDIKIQNSKFTFLNPVIYVGLANETKGKSFIRLPEIFKPSPLNFLYKFIKSNEKLDAQKVFFSFLDFDAF